ncbi:MAG: hypothetical protein IJF82_20885 [Achromobacter sp.]|nr:hypothetical protein [Achromobacter sp.]
MYRIEIFDQSMDYVSACYTDDAQTISLDYLAFDPFQINIQPVAVKKGYFCHITKNNVTVADCIVSDVKPGKELQEISLRPLQALFDAEVFYNAVTDAITWIGNNLTAQYINSTDTYQLRPLVITTTPGSRAFPLTGYNLNPTMNILSVITNAFRTWGVVTEASLDLVNKQILVNIYEQTATKTIECDLENVISSEVTLGDSYGSTNKLIVKKTVAEGSPTGTTEITYYRHNDGSISTTDTDRIVPVFWDVETLEQSEDMTDADWIAETETMAKETLTPAKYDNEVVIAVWEDDKIVNPKDIALGTITTLYIKGTTYYSILTGETIEGNVYTLTFGAVRTELTKKLAIQSRSNGTSSGGSGGGGGGGGGDVTGVKGDAESVYRVGDVNITPANIGLGNVDNTSDADKPISTATQTALNNKVDKVTGKGLSTNDYTTAEKTKLAGIEEGAQVNTVTGVKGNAESSYRTGNINLTKANIGLGNVDNTSDANKPISTATQTALDNKVDKETGKGLSSNDFTDTLLSKLNGIESGAQVNTVTGVKGSAESSYRVGNINITKANIGLGNVDNTSDANKPISTATQTALDAKVDKVTGMGLSTNDFTDALLSKLNGIESGAQVNTVTGVKGNSESTYRTGNINITKANIGLGNVDNTSDANKPISTATQTALDNKVDKVTGKGLSANDFTDTLLSKLNGIESGAQVNTVTGVKGSAETSYRTGNINITKANIGLGNVDNTSDVNKPISTATQTALDAKVDKVTGMGLSSNDFTTAEKNKLSGIESGAQVNTITGVKGNAESSYRTGNVNLTKANIGLGNVDNTSDANKPISTAMQTALDGKVNTTDIATTSDLGLVMPDGTSITIDADGTIHSVGGGGGSSSEGGVHYYSQQTVSVASSAEILRITDSSITASTVVLECTFANPSAISGDVTWTSYNGYISFVGTCTSATTANVTLTAVSDDEAEDFYSQVTFSETPTNATFKKWRNIVFITWQGAATTHSAQQDLCTLPSGYRPEANVFVPFVVNSYGIGYVQIRASDGIIRIDQIQSAATASGRVYFSVAYIV